MRSELARLFDEVPDDLPAYFDSLDGAPVPALLDGRTAADLTL
jgi:hypothetical protein